MNSIATIFACQSEIWVSFTDGLHNVWVTFLRCEYNSGPTLFILDIHVSLMFEQHFGAFYESFEGSKMQSSSSDLNFVVDSSSVLD